MSDFYKQFETPLDRAVDKAIAEVNAEAIEAMKRGACPSCGAMPDSGQGCWSCMPEEFAAYRAEVARWATEIKEFSKRTGRNPHLVVDQVKYEITLPHETGDRQ